MQRGSLALLQSASNLHLPSYTQLSPLQAAVELLTQDGISAELIDPRTLAPLEGVMPTILKSVQKTGRLLTSDDGSYSFSNCTMSIRLGWY